VGEKLVPSWTLCDSWVGYPFKHRKYYNYNIHINHMGKIWY
jgi:hypothetical protein